MKRNCFPLAVLLLLAATASSQAQFFYTFNAASTSYIITGYYGPDGSVSIPEKIDNLYVTGIADYAFYEENGVTNVTIPSSVTTIGASAFAQTGLTSVTIPGSVTSIGASAFANCGNLTNATIEYGVIVIGASAFNSCPILAAVTVPSSVISIEPYAFTYCLKLTNVTLASGLISIGDDAFSMTGINSISIPSSVAVIGEEAFYYCRALTAITVDVENTNYSSADGVLFDKTQTTLIQYPGGLSGAYTIPSGVTSIENSTFANSWSIDSVTIPGSVKSIGENAFFNCNYLTNLTLANGVGSIASSAFFGCNGLRSMTIPASVTNIGADALGIFPLQPSFYFLGDAPSADPLAFSGVDPGTVYYLPGTTGWSNTLGGLPTAQWKLPNPVILNSTSNFGIQSNGFGFSISWATNRPVVVQASTDLANPVWTSLQTNALTNGVFNFTDPQWANYSGRFYRIIAQ
jgi:hypothetical protein